MTPDQIKSLIRHALTAIGFVLGLIGLNKFLPVLDYVIANLDAVVAAVMTLVGFVTMVIGFFRNKERFG